MREHDQTGSRPFAPSASWSPEVGLPEAPDRDEARFVLLGLIDEGGMGRVDRMYDRHLMRNLARKVMKPGLPSGAQARFTREARITARLQHPGIVPVIDMGRTPEDQPYYLMPEVPWKRLYERMPVAGARDDARLLRSLVETLRRICDIVAFAHDQRIVHRDLKPANVLVGDFGEVMVLDWGVAKDLGASETEATDASLVDRDAFGTVIGRGIGTPGYMPPEQVEGRHHDTGPWSDVFALGVILHEIVTGIRPAAALPDRDVPTGTMQGVARSPDYVASAPVFTGFPHGLDLICARALARRAELRFADAKSLGRALGDWLDGVFRRERALVRVGEARALEPQIAALRRSAESLQAAARRALVGVTPATPLSVKREAWSLEEQADAVMRQAERFEVQRFQALKGALEVDPDLDEAHAALAAYHQAEHRRAELLGDVRATEAHILDLRQHDRASVYASYIEGSGRLTLVTDPAGARVYLEEYVRRDRRLVPEPRGELGVTPLVEVRLPRGSFRLRIVAPGRHEVYYPVNIGRAEHWDGVAPGGDAPTPVWLPPEGMLGPDDCYVPPGWFTFGGDGVAPDGLRARRLWVDGFVVRRYPVTVAAYFLFLNDVSAQGRREEAIRHAPDDRNGNKAYVLEEGSGRFLPGGRPFGDEWAPDWPVSLVDWHGACAYATWEASRTGRPWRLLHEVEREKAGRGVDARHYPWGDAPEPSWTCMLASHVGPPRKRAVGALTDDVSPYGVSGMGGNVRDWCLNTFQKDGPPAGSRLCIAPPDSLPERPVARGGSFNSDASFCRIDARFAALPDRRTNISAIRLCWGVRGSS